MSAKLILGSHSSIVTVAAATLAGFIAIGILSAVVGLFQSRGVPMERLARAERACMSHVYQSERRACMKQLLAKSKNTDVARK